MKNAGFILVVVTNQPDVGNRLVDQSVVEAMNASLMKQLSQNAIKVCFYKQAYSYKQTYSCDCRKPKADMLIDAAGVLNIDLPNSFMVGDRVGGIIAGQASGC